MAKRIKPKKIKGGFKYNIESIIFIVLFGIITFLTGRYFGKKENYRFKINSNTSDNFENNIIERLANLNKI